MGYESSKTLEAPEELIRYEKWWKDTFGRTPNLEEDEELVELTHSLAKNDERFKGILAESLINEFIDSEDGLASVGKRRWAMVHALSTYGKELGLSVD